jgi:tripartite-type tricarboxylate transporter receptor subunit TctC
MYGGAHMQSTKMNPLMIILLLLILIGSIPSGTKAADYPEKPATMLVGFPNGGPADLVARALAETVKPFFAKPVIVVNKPGGSSAIATAELIRSAPDGYTLCTVFSPAVTISPFVTSLPYKGPSDLQPIINAIKSVSFFIVRGDAPWRTMKEALEYAKANPGKLRVGSPGIGSGGHLCLENLKELSKIDMTHVPFEGAAPMIAALLGGHIEAIQGSSGGAVSGLLKAGKVKFLANYDAKRVSLFPEVPTFTEMGYNVMDATSYYYVGAPKRTHS